MSISVSINLSEEFKNGFPQSVDTSMRNLAGLVRSQVAVAAPFDTGALVASGKVVKNGVMDYSVIFDVPYAAVRDAVNNLHPDRQGYVKKGTDNALNLDFKQWVDPRLLNKK